MKDPAATLPPTAPDARGINRVTGPKDTRFVGFKPGMEAPAPAAAPDTVDDELAVAAAETPAAEIPAVTTAPVPPAPPAPPAAPAPFNS